MKSIDEMTYIEMIAEASKVKMEMETTTNKYKAKDLYRYWQRLMKAINFYRKLRTEKKEGVVEVEDNQPKTRPIRRIRKQCKE